MNKLIVLVAVTLTAVGIGAETKKTKKTVKVTAPSAKVESTVNTTATAPAAAATTTTTTTTTTPATLEATTPNTGTSSSASSFPAPASTTATTTTETISSSSTEGHLIGEIDIRPTTNVVAEKNSSRLKFFTENAAALGYQFTKDSNLQYYQLFNTNLYDPTPGNATGLGLVASDGFLRGKVNNIWKNDSGTSFNYEGRLYAPTAAGPRDAGFNTALRTYLKLRHDFNSFVTVQLSEIPIIPVYSRAGTGTGPLAKANPAFENRVYLITTLNFTSKLSLDIPIMFHQTRNRTYADAANSNSWSYFAWTYPELTYSPDTNNAFGVAYYSSNLIKPDLTGFDIGTGFDGGAAQVFYRASL